MKHEYSTIFMVGCFFIIAMVFVIATFTSDDIDEFCSNSSAILYRNSTGWECFEYSYGEMWEHEDNDTTLVFGVQDVYVNMTNMTSGLINDMTYSSNELLVLTDGVYKVDYSISFSGQTGSTHGMGIEINGTKQENCYAQRKLGSADVGNSGGTCLITLYENNIVNLVMADEDAGLNDVIIHSANLNLMRISV